MKLRAAPRSRAESGFSLIEILTVVAIIGVLAAFAFPMILNYLRFYQIRAGASEVASTIQQARNTAIKRNANWGVVFFVRSTTQYQFYSEDVPSAPQARQDYSASQAAGTAGPVMDLPRGIEFEAPSGGGGFAAIRFDRFGLRCQVVSGSSSCPGVAGSLPASANLLGPPPSPLPSGATSDDFVITLRKADQPGLVRHVAIGPGGRVRALQ